MWAMTELKFIAKGDVSTCERCGKTLKNEIAWLHLNSRTGQYSQTEFLPEEEDQGWFAFGKPCARRVLRNGGFNDGKVR